jgi:hypothetical protein
VGRAGGLPEKVSGIILVAFGTFRISIFTTFNGHPISYAFDDGVLHIRLRAIQDYGTRMAGASGENRANYRRHLPNPSSGRTAFLADFFRLKSSGRRDKLGRSQPPQAWPCTWRTFNFFFRIFNPLTGTV